jgi:hypothetical protein
MTRKISALLIEENDGLHYLSLNDDGTHQLCLMHRDHAWWVSTLTLRGYLDLQGVVRKVQSASNDLLLVEMHAGQCYVYQQNATLAKPSLRPWEREAIAGKKFREICTMFGLTPEQLEWNGDFTPRHLGKYYDWKEVVDVKLQSFEEQTETVAQRIRDLKSLIAYIARKYPSLENPLLADLKSAQIELQNLLTFHSIANNTDPVDIPQWAWKEEPYGRCKSRTYKAFEDRYAKEGLLQKEEAQ